MMDNVFITFGAGRTGWLKASKRLSKEATATGLFSSVYCLGVDWLQSWDTEIYEIAQSFRQKGKYRGFGYWTWKPALLNWADLFFPNSQIIYMDAGCHIDSKPHQISIFQHLLEESKTNGGLAWHLPNHSDISWSKREVIEFIKPNQKDIYRDQVWAGFIALPPSAQRLSFARDWRDMALVEQGFYFSDELIFEQDVTFVEHRHDQSAFSLLWKKYDFISCSDQTDPNNLGTFPIIAARNNTSINLASSLSSRRFHAYTDLLTDIVFRKK